MRRLTKCLDIMTTLTLTTTGWYMYAEFADLFSRALMIGLLTGIGLLTVIQVEYSMNRAKRRTVNVIEPETANLPLDMGRQ
jgi:MFS superfamily sulfate permease-like transporter